MDRSGPIWTRLDQVEPDQANALGLRRLDQHVTVGRRSNLAEAPQRLLQMRVDLLCPAAQLQPVEAAKARPLPVLEPIEHAHRREGLVVAGVIEQARGLDMDAVRQEVAAAQEAAANGPQDEVGLDDFAAAHSQGAYVVDVREADEVAGGRVPGAVHIPMNDVPARMAELPRDTPFFVICAVGGRSRQVVDHLRAEGLPAINVAGGTGGWAQRGWPLES